LEKYFCREELQLGLKIKLIVQKNYHSIGFQENRLFLCRKFAKIVIITLTPKPVSEAIVAQPFWHRRWHTGLPDGLFSNFG
jgi:hypothetical protein